VKDLIDIKQSDKSVTVDRRPTTSSDYVRKFALSRKSFHPSTRTVPDSFAPPTFSGTDTDADTWLITHFRGYTEYRQLSDRDVTAIFPLFLKDSAIDWYDMLFADLKNDLESLLENFKAYFGKTELDHVFAHETVFTRVQRPNEKARDYISQMQKLAKWVARLQEKNLALGDPSRYMSMDQSQHHFTKRRPEDCRGHSGMCKIRRMGRPWKGR